MSLIRINRKPSPKDLRVFSALWLIFLLALGAIAFSKGYEKAAIAACALSIGIGGLGLVFPRSARPVYIGAMYATFPIGFALSHLILAVIYFLLLTPIGLVMRLMGRDPLHRRFDPQKFSYWEARSQERSPASYLKQY